MNFSVTTPGIDWNITRFGTGSEILFAFHGFGEEGRTFLNLQESLGKYFTVYSIDLPFHGGTVVRQGHPGQKEIYEIMHMMIQQTGTENFSLAGYSMGGKICLDLAGRFAPQINRMILLAPDGIRTS